jgi:WD40 repeat protein
MALWDRTDGSTRRFQLPPLSAETESPHVSIPRFSPNGALISVLRSNLQRSNKPDNETEFADLTVFDVATGKQLAHLDLPFTCGGAQVSSDGRLAILATRQREVKCFDLNRGQEIWTRASKFADERGAFFASVSVHLSPDGRLVGCTDIQPRTRGPGLGPIHVEFVLLDTATGHEVRSLPGVGANNVVWSPDSSRLATCPLGGFGSNGPSSFAVAVFDVATGKMSMKVERGQIGIAATQVVLAFSPDGRRLAGHLSTRGRVNETDTVKIWEIETGTELLNLPLASPVAGRVGSSLTTSLAFSPDGYRLICAERPNGPRGPALTIVRVIDATPPERKQP